MAQTAGIGEDQKGRQQFDEKSAEGERIEEPRGRMLDIVGERIRQGLGEEVEAQSLEISPGGVAGGQLNDARLEHEAEEKKTVSHGEP